MSSSWFMLAVALLFLAMAVHAIKTGRTLSRFGRVSRKNDPVRFRIAVATQLVSAAMLTFFAVWDSYLGPLYRQ